MYLNPKRNEKPVKQEGTMNTCADLNQAPGCYVVKAAGTIQKILLAASAQNDGSSDYSGGDSGDPPLLKYNMITNGIIAIRGEMPNMYHHVSDFATCRW